MSEVKLKPSSQPLEQWLDHITGKKQLIPKPGFRRLTEAVDLNRDAERIISTFGDKEFGSLIGFIDMRGFSNAVKGKSPTETAAFVEVFVEVIIKSAKANEWFIDKTIGDEVMIVCPFYGDDAVFADIGLQNRENTIFEISKLVSDILINLRERAHRGFFTCGFSLGRASLKNVGTPEFSEWTCYGNAVNIAKRVQ